MFYNKYLSLITNYAKLCHWINLDGFGCQSVATKYRARKGAPNDANRSWRCWLISYPVWSHGLFSVHPDESRIILYRENQNAHWCTSNCARTSWRYERSCKFWGARRSQTLWQNSHEIRSALDCIDVCCACWSSNSRVQSSLRRAKVWLPKELYQRRDRSELRSGSFAWNSSRQAQEWLPKRLFFKWRRELCLWGVSCIGSY